MRVEVSEKQAKLYKQLMDRRFGNTHQKSRGYDFYNNPIPNLTLVSEDDKQWLCGFVEGDGSICLKYEGPAISIGQRDREVLDFVQHLVMGGKIYIPRRGASLLLFNGYPRCKPLLELIRTHAVCEKTKRKMLDVFGESIQVHKPTLSWIVGFWDAEGSFSLDASQSQIVAQIGQVEREPLEIIQETIGGHLMHFNNDWSGAWKLVLRKQETRDFIRDYLRYAHNLEKLERLSGCLEKVRNASPRGRPKKKLLEERV